MILKVNTFIKHSFFFVSISVCVCVILESSNSMNFRLMDGLTTSILDEDIDDDDDDDDDDDVKVCILFNTELVKV